MAAPLFSGLHFWVRDMDAMLAFYRAVGLDLGEQTSAEFHNAGLPNGFSLAFGTDGLTRQYDAGFEPPAGGGKGPAALQFDLESRAAVDEMHERLTGLGYASHLAPIDAFWGSRYAEVIDPDGNVCGFHSPREPRG